jgi:hypothetical protein
MGRPFEGGAASVRVAACEFVRAGRIGRSKAVDELEEIAAEALVQRLRDMVRGPSAAAAQRREIERAVGVERFVDHQARELGRDACALIGRKARARVRQRRARRLDAGGPCALLAKAEPREKIQRRDEQHVEKDHEAVRCVRARKAPARHHDPEHGDQRDEPPQPCEIEQRFVGLAFLAQRTRAMDVPDRECEIEKAGNDPRVIADEERNAAGARFVERAEGVGERERERRGVRHEMHERMLRVRLDGGRGQRSHVAVKQRTVEPRDRNVDDMQPAQRVRRHGCAADGKADAAVDRKTREIRGEPR